jgi:FkbM family methyltransferase
LKTFFEKYIWKFLRKTDSAYHASKTSFSQQGEDILIDFIFTWMLNCPKPSYLDIGANHPSNLSNTYFFYKKGCKGVNVEPDPSLIKLLKAKRKNDENIHAGVGEKKGELDFYIMGTSTLNTFSKETADAFSLSAHYGKPAIKEVIKVQVIPINEILEKYFSNTNDYFISIDVEGLDYNILKSIDFEKYRPAVVCIETDAMFDTDAERYTILLNTAGYSKYGENMINSIYIDKARLEIFNEHASK